MSNKSIGDLGESLARGFLESKGYRILDTNYRCPGGEIDIVARQDDFLVFIEVRTRTSLDFGSPEESVTPAKKGRLIATAQHYRQGHYNMPASWCIDFIGIMLHPRGGPPGIDHIPNAITG
jgi:putative endonuclease